MKITTLHTFDTTYPADTIEWCPNDGFRSFLACGTYELDSNNTETSLSLCRRKGTIILIKFIKETRNLFEVFRIETAAILDMKWLPLCGLNPILATANAIGEIVLYALEQERLVKRSSSSISPEDENRLTLSLDWGWPSNATVSTKNIKLLASDSKGDISLLEYDGLQKLTLLKTWHAHDFEAWICTFDKWDSNKVYTGGDDLMLNAYDMRTYERILTNRSHNAGVTSMLSHPKYENMLLTGSYDECVRIFDTRSMRHPLGEINLQGGIWRIKADPYKGDLILTACMYKNFSILRMSSMGSDGDLLKLVSTYDEHESICYGADWCLDVNGEFEDDSVFMATCSFYDHKLCISSVVLQK